jgi:hypothetical protein
LLLPPPFAAAAAAAAARQYFKLPGEFVSLIQCDVAQRISSAIGQWLETVKVRQQAGGRVAGVAVAVPGWHVHTGVLSSECLRGRLG